MLHLYLAYNTSTTSKLCYKLDLNWQFSSMNIPRDLDVDTCLTGISWIETSTESDSVLGFYIEPVTIKSGVVVFRVSLFQISHLLI